jgi:methionyl-tRNA synthetase
VIGKEILWFHSVIWPAMLMALELPLPECVYAHSFWISEGQKMSKSLGNFIDLEAIDAYLDAYGLDAWRYFLTTNGPMGATDADFAAHHFHEVYSTDLVNTVGNCASRVTSMINKYFDGAVPECPDGAPEMDGYDWPQIAADAVARWREAMDGLELAPATAAALALVRKVDGYINATEPFKLAKDESRREELGAILYRCVETVRIASLLLWPVIPFKMDELWTALGLSVDPAAGRDGVPAPVGRHEAGHGRAEGRPLPPQGGGARASGDEPLRRCVTEGASPRASTRCASRCIAPGAVRLQPERRLVRLRPRHPSPGASDRPRRRRRRPPRRRRQSQASRTSPIRPASFPAR